MSRKWLLALSFFPFLIACNRTKPADAPKPASGPVVKYPIRGKIISVNKDAVMLDHEAIPGFMGAMTMAYNLKDPSIVSELHPGDRITATLLVSKDADGFNTALIDQVVVIAQARPDYKPAVQYHVPQAGDVVPDFKLLNQAANPIHIAQFQGQVLLVTFIYTRCPLDEFCPRMSRNFAEVHKALSQDPSLASHTHLLSISFDPEYDTPRILHSYGEAYVGHDSKDMFQHWDFAAPKPDDIAALTQFFDVGITPGDAQTITHSLSTVLIGKDGKVIAWYPTNDWKPSDIVKEIQKAATA